MKRALIFCNGDLTDLRNIKQKLNAKDYVICADGGAKHLQKLGIIPDVIIGDFDSLSEEDQKKYAITKTIFIPFPKEKNETDSELAFTYAKQKEFKKILIFGILGSRIDHMLTNIFTLNNLLNNNLQVTIIEGNQEIQLVKNKTKLNGKKGDLVSLIPLNADAQKVTTKNLLYPLKNETLKFGYSRGISNVLIQNTAEISLRKGSLLIVHTRS